MRSNLPGHKERRRPLCNPRHIQVFIERAVDNETIATCRFVSGIGHLATIVVELICSRGIAIIGYLKDSGCFGGQQVVVRLKCNVIVHKVVGGCGIESVNTCGYCSCVSSINEPRPELLVFVAW